MVPAIVEERINASEPIPDTRGEETPTATIGEQIRAPEPIPGTSREEAPDAGQIRESEPSPGEPAFKYIAIVDEKERVFKRFNILGREASIRILPPPEETDVVEYLENAFREIHAYAINSSAANDYVGLSIVSGDLARGPAGLSFRPAGDLTHADIWNLVSSLAQSCGGHDILEGFNVSVYNVAAFSGRGGDSNKLTHEDVAKRSILDIANVDNLCFPRSLITAMVYNERGNVRTGELHERWQSVRRQNSTLQRRLAIELTEKAGVVVPPEGCGIAEIERFQHYLAGYDTAIYVHYFSTFGRGAPPMYDGSGVLASLGREIKYKLNILFYECRRHFNPILNLRAASGSREYCVPCNQGYRHANEHRCSKICTRCRGEPSGCVEAKENIIRCNSCNREFYGRVCYERHRADRSYDGGITASVCQTVRLCGECGRVKKKNFTHKCNEEYCVVCGSSQDLNHLCFMRPLPRVAGSSMKKPSSSSSRTETVDPRDNDNDDSARAPRSAFIFYDFETRQDDTLVGTENVKTHVVTLCVAQQVCEFCMGEDDMSLRCRWCGVREFVFRENPVKQFVQFATRPVKDFKLVICIAHNAGAFDAQFILRYLVESGKGAEARLILNGTKIVLLTVGLTKFIDSVNYMPMRLSMLPKAFGLRDTAGKGSFPHLFNTVGNQSYIGPLPDAKFYSPDTMKPDEREQFLTWHAEMVEKNTVFDFQREIVHYCRNDVNILRRACLAYRRIFLDRGNVCPFEECTTIASTCMRVFRKNFLREKEIGIIPSNGYRFADNQSMKALRWILWEERKLGREIIHAGRAREHRLPGGVRVDGYYETVNPAQRHVLQFHGCFWHGCPGCFRVNRDRALSTAVAGDTIDTRYERTRATTHRLRKRGYIVTEKWECDFDRELRENRELREFVEAHPMLRNAPLDPRDAFYGGRTGNIVTRYEARGTEKIRYVDVCSLYPYVLKTAAFPIGHPVIYVGEECARLIGAAPDFNFSSVEGIVRCKVLAPRDLFHPVLPFRAHGKLLFALCRSCCETLCQDACTHDDPAEREFEGAWVSCELRKAIEKGYRVTAVSEIWSYEISRYDPDARQGGLFAEYINCFLQLKQEASGWPSECQDEEAKERYLNEYRETEGIALDRANITVNPGLRSVAKLCLNSFWGKFGQRANLPTTEIVTSSQHLMSLLTSPEHEITSILPVNDDALYVTWRLRQEAIAVSKITNVVIAAFTTAHARLKLYDYLEKLDRRVLYYDTDSCVYVSTGDPTEYEPRTGNFLGDMTDELESYGRGSYIESFVSAGPKFYSYVVRTARGDTHEVCKVRGITLNFETSRRINFNSIKKLLLAGKISAEEDEEIARETSINLRFRAIRRTAFHDVVTRGETKSCTPVLLKRRFNVRGCSVPYGYRSAR